MDFNTFIQDNYIVIIVVGVIIIMTIIGYFAQKTEFGKKVSEKNKKNIQPENTNEIETLGEQIENNVQTNENDQIEQLDILDTIAPNFNEGGLIIGDVNQNPDVTNEQLGIDEDLYAPFGDDSTTSLKNGFDELKIEDVPEVEEFNIIEPEKNNNVEETLDEEILKDINAPLEDSLYNVLPENLVIEEAEQIFDANADNQEIEEEPFVSEINNIVDNTLVINNDVEEFNMENMQPIELVETNDSSIDSESKIQQFVIEEDNDTNEPTDFEIEATTSLKLDEINEKIKNLKLEDLDNPNLEEEMTSNLKKKKKNKKVSIKSIDDIKNEADQNIKEELINSDNDSIAAFEIPNDMENENNVENNSININDETNDLIADFENVSKDLELPNLDDITSGEKEVEETDNIWNF